MWNLDNYIIRDQMQFVDLLPNDNFNSLKSNLGSIILEKSTSQSHSITSGQVPMVDEYNWIYELIGNIVKEVNLKFFEFDVTHFHNLHYVIHNEGDYHHEHIDYESEGGVWDFRKLSFSLLLNDEFEGGDLEILGKEKFVADKKSNSIIFYPSYMRHQISPVTSGARHSLEGWICGPKFR